MYIYHIGVCVYSVDAAIERLRNTIGVSSVSYTDLPDRKQRSAYVKLGDRSDVFELMEPLGEGGTVNDFLAKHGEGIHHISFRVENAEETAQKFEADGARIIGRGQGLAFVHPKGNFGMLFEIVDDSYK